MTFRIKGFNVSSAVSPICLLFPLIGLEPCPSLLLQRHMAELLSMDKDMAASFLNSVLNQLNWAFSEFIGMIQEVKRNSLCETSESSSLESGGGG